MIKFIKSIFSSRYNAGMTQQCIIPGLEKNRENLIVSEPKEDIFNRETIESLKAQLKNLQEQIEELNLTDNSLGILIGRQLSNNPIIRNSDISYILKENRKVDIRFKFNWKDYTSVIKIIGRDNNEEYEYLTPQIPLIGGAWSNLVATRCLTGQIFVSALLECVRIQLEFMVKDYNLDTEVIKHDNCFYAPFMEYCIDGNNKLSHPCDSDVHSEYHEILKKHYPESYIQVINLKKGENYWDKYHDIN